MALSLAQEPQEISFSKDPIIFEFQTDNLLVSAGVAAINLITFTGSAPEDEVVVLRWGNTELRMIAKATPGLAHEFPSGTSDLSVLLPFFRDNHTLDKDFTIVIDSGAIKMTAKKAGAKFNMSSVTFDGGIVGNTTTGIDDVFRKNFQVYYELYIEKQDSPGNYKMINQDTIPVDAISFRVQLDVSQLLHSNLEADMPYNFFTPAALCRKSKRKYYLRIAEAFGEKPQIQHLTKLDAKHVVLGGTSKQNRKTVIGKLLGDSANLDACLRYGDTTRFVLQEEKQYLYFLLLRNDAYPKLRATIYYSDETSEVSEGVGLVDLKKYDKVFFDASLASFATDDEKIVVKYEVHVADGNNSDEPISKLYTYVIDYAYRKNVRRFLYVNSLGAVDCLTSFGKGTKEIEFQKQIAEKADDDITLTQFQDFSIESRETYEVATGFKSKRELGYMRDFFLSEDKFVQQSGKWLPINVNNKSVQEYNDANNLQGYKFEYALAHSDDSLSDDDLDDIIGFPLPPQGFLGGGDIILNVGVPGTFIIDENPTESSTNAVSSGGVYNYFLLKQDKIVLGTVLQYFRGDLSLGTLGEDIQAILNTRNYLHTQVVAADTWTIVHNLGKKVICQVYNTDGVQVNGKISHISENELKVNFNNPEAGYSLLMGI